MKRKMSIKVISIILFGLASLLNVLTGFAQQGHPLTGSWSGYRIVDGKSSRVLLVMDLNRDQTISGYLLEDGQRVPVEAILLDPKSWTVAFSLADSKGGPHYKVEASFKDMGSATNRKLEGKWAEGKSSGNFQVGLN